MRAALLLLLAIAAHGQGLGPSRSTAASVIVSANNNGQASTSTWGNCGTTLCAGGAGNTTGISQTTGNASPSVSGASMGLLATFPASGNNVLYYWKPGPTCDTCTWIRYDLYAYVPAGVANYEFDSFIFNKSNGNWNAMFGKQCNTVTGFWQYANAVSGWTNSAIVCSLSTSTWHHMIFSDFYSPSDTSCSGGVPCLHFGSLTIDGVTSSWGGVTLPITTLDPTFASIIGCQAQMDSSAAGSLTEYVDNVSCWVGK